MFKLKDYSWYKKWTFPAGEIGVEVTTFLNPTAEEFFIEAEIVDTDDIMELLLVSNALKHMLKDGQSLSLILPYIPYGRQDRVTAKGTSFSLNVFAQMINQVGYKSVHTDEPHSDQSYLIKNLKVRTRFTEQLRSYLRELDKDNIVFIAPDKGARERVEYHAKFCGVKDVVHALKYRGEQSGDIIGMGIEAVPKDKHLVVVDDICDGGRTFIELSKLLPKDRRSLHLCVSHGIFSKGKKVIYDAGYDTIWAQHEFLYRWNTSDFLPETDDFFNELYLAEDGKGMFSE